MSKSYVRLSWIHTIRASMNQKLSDYRCRPNRTNLFLERMEERTTPTVTVNLIGNELKLTYGAASDAVTFSNEGTSI
ncbi:MAG: hypothetical protein ACOYNP_15870, partial [Gemmataceae bacterium]